MVLTFLHLAAMLLDKLRRHALQHTVPLESYELAQLRYDQYLNHVLQQL